jgi:phage replication initiation protein
MNNSVFCDWLSFTIDIEARDIIPSILGDPEIVLKSGLNGYSEGYITIWGALVCFSPDKPQNRIWINLSAKTLANFSKQIDSVQDLVLSFADYRPKITRIDIAKDCFTDLLNLDLIEKKIKTGEYSSRYREYKIYKKLDVLEIYSKKKKENGRTFYLGSKLSDSFMRIYDKKAESGSKEHENWVRVEMQFRRDHAEQIFRKKILIDKTGKKLKEASKTTETAVEKFISQRNLNSVFMNYLKFLDESFYIREEEGFPVLQKHKKSRWSISDFWKEFLETDVSERLEFPKYTKSLEDITDWLLRQTSGSDFLAQKLVPGWNKKKLDKGKENFEKNLKLKLLMREHEKNNRGT